MDTLDGFDWNAPNDRFVSSESAGLLATASTAGGSSHTDISSVMVHVIPCSQIFIPENTFITTRSERVIDTSRPRGNNETKKTWVAEWVCKE